MNDYDAKVLELAEKHDAFLPAQILNILEGHAVPFDELDLWMQSARQWQPCLFKAQIVGQCDKPLDPAVRKYMKKLLKEAHDAEVERQRALAERGTVGEEP